MKSSLFRSPCALVAASVLLFAATGCSPEAKKASYLKDADRYFDAGQYDRAEIEYLNVVAIEVFNPRAVSQLGTIYFEQGRFGRSIPFIFKTRELQPDNLLNRRKAARLLIVTGNLAEAQKEATYILDRAPDDPEAPLLLAEAATKPEEIEAVRQRLAKLPSPVAESAPILIALGTLEIRQEHLDAAESYFKKAQAKDPKSAAAYAALGTLYRVQRRNPEAEAALKTAMELAPARSQRKLLYPRFKIQTGDVAGGRQLLEETVKQTPDFLPPLIMLADLAAAEKKFDEALDLAGKVLARDPVNPEALLLSSRMRLAKGEIDKAFAELEKAVKVFPRSPQIYYQLGAGYLARRDIDKAVINLNRAISLSPDYTEAILMLAEVNLRRGDYIAAIAALKPVVQKHPEIAQARLMLADAYRAQGDPKAALAEYRRLEELFPRSPQTHVLKGNILAQQNDLKAARDAYAKALEISPNFLPAIEQLVDLDLQEKKFPDALQLVEPLLAQNPPQTVAYLLQAKIYNAQRDVAKTEAVLRHAIELQPDSPTAYLMLARLYVSSAQLDQALKNFQTTVAKNPKSVESWMLIGMINEQQKNYAGARDAYEKLLAVNPDFASALNNLACLYSEHFDQPDRARDLAQRARELMPHEPHIAESLGWILYQQRQFQRAAGLLLESVTKLPTSPVAQYHTGIACYTVGDEANANRYLKRSLELDPKSPDAAAAQQCLDILAINPATAGAAERAALEKRAREQPDDPVALSRLAAVYARAGEAEKALRTCEAALKANPNHVPSLVQMTQLQVALKDNAKALEFAKNARRLAPQDPEIAQTLGRLAYETGDFGWSASLLQEALADKPGQPDLLYEFAEAAYRNGQIAEAEDAARQAAQSVFLQKDQADLLAAMAAVANRPAQAGAAASRVDAALRADPDYVPALYAQGLIKENGGQPDEARQAYEKVLGKCPDFAPAKKRLAALNVRKAGEKK